ncbi:MAG: carboxypeptidase regulatory-like domain-containing protein, partial [Nitrospinota bacterium]
KRSAVAALAVGALALSWTAPAWSYEVVEVSNGGKVTGTIRFQGTPPPPAKIRITKNPERCGTEPRLSEEFVVSKKGGLANVVVTLVGVKKGKAFPKKSPRIIQRKCWFTPRVSLIPVGKRFRLVNEDKILHNFRTMSKKNPSLNIAHPKFKKTIRVKKKFSKPETMRIACDIHKWMTGWVVAIEHPYYAVSSKTGKFTLRNVPPGTYKLRAWHEKLGVQTQTVTVGAGGSVKADFTFKK